MSPGASTGYVVPRYRAEDAAFHHVLHGTVPGHQIDFLYCPEVPQGALRPTHFGHLARLIKYIEPRDGAPYAFAIGNLSRDDVQHSPGHGGIAVLFALRVPGVVDHAGRDMPPYAHGVVAVDRELTQGTLLQTVRALHEHFLGREGAEDRRGDFYRAYVRTMRESPSEVADFLARAIRGFDDLPSPPRSTLGWDYVVDEGDPPRRIALVYDEPMEHGMIAYWASRIVAFLYRSNIKWTSVSTGREIDIAGGTTIRFVPRAEAREVRGGPTFELEDLPEDEAALASLLFGARPRASAAARPAMGWREALAGHVQEPFAAPVPAEPSGERPRADVDVEVDIDVDIEFPPESPAAHEPTGDGAARGDESENILCTIPEDEDEASSGAPEGRGASEATVPAAPWHERGLRDSGLWPGLAGTPGPAGAPEPAGAPAAPGVGGDEPRGDAGEREASRTSGAREVNQPLDDRTPDDITPNDGASDNRTSDDGATDDRTFDLGANDQRTPDTGASDDRALDDRAIDSMARDDRALASRPPEDGPRENGRRENGPPAPDGVLANRPPENGPVESSGALGENGASEDDEDEVDDAAATIPVATLPGHGRRAVLFARVPEPSPPHVPTPCATVDERIVPLDDDGEGPFRSHGTGHRVLIAAALTALALAIAALVAMGLNLGQGPPPAELNDAGAPPLAEGLSSPSPSPTIPAGEAGKAGDGRGTSGTVSREAIDRSEADTVRDAGSESADAEKRVALGAEKHDAPGAEGTAGGTRGAPAGKFRTAGSTATGETDRPLTPGGLSAAIRKPRPTKPKPPPPWRQPPR